MKQQIVVLGMHRSGTSTISMILKELGVNMGEETLDGSSSNPFGYEEDSDVLELNISILNQAKGSWDFPPKAEAIDRIISAFEEDINKIIINRDNRNDIWGWKEPRTTLLIDYYSRYLSNPKYICIYRDANEVALSLKKRNKMPIKKGIKLHTEYNLRMDKFITKIKLNRVLKLNFGELHYNSEALIDKLIKFLDIEVSDQNYLNAIDVIKPMNVVREKRKELKSREFSNNLKQAIKHPVKALRFISRETLNLIRYHLT